MCFLLLRSVAGGMTFLLGKKKLFFPIFSRFRSFYVQYFLFGYQFALTVYANAQLYIFHTFVGRSFSEKQIKNKQMLIK